MYNVSVVVPVYNVEQVIVRCAESLFKQTLDDMQFIFVDDASPDKSILLLEQTLERFPQRKHQTIILHHTRNRGLPMSRATGLEYVEAPYVAHCDSDDYVEPTMYEKLYNCAMQNNSDMVVCGRKVHYIDGKEHISIDRPIMSDSFINNFLQGRLSPCVWSRLTRSDIYRKIHFPSGSYLEDIVQTAQLLTYASRISFVDDCLYHYVKNPFSISGDMSQDLIAEKMQQGLANYNLMHDFIVGSYPDIKEKDFALRKEKIRRSIFLPQTQRRQYLHTFPELNYSIFFCRAFSWRYKVSLFLILLGIYPIAQSSYGFIKRICSDIRPKPLPTFSSAVSTKMTRRKHV